MDHFADIPTHSAKRHKSCQILSPSQNTLSDTQQYVTNTAKFCPPLKTYSQTLSNTSSILSNSVPKQYAHNMRTTRSQYSTDMVEHCLPKATGQGESGWCSDVTSTHGAWRHAGVRFLLSGATYSLRASGDILEGRTEFDRNPMKRL